MLVCLSPQVSLVLAAPLWILLPISYIAMEKPSNRDHNPSTFKDVPYRPLEPTSSDASEPRLSCNDMLFLVWQTQPLFIALFLSNASKHLILNGVVTTMAFSNIPVSPRNQYLLYVLSAGVGEVLGRPYLGYLSFCGMEDKFMVRKTWYLAFLNVFILLIMLFVCWFRITFLSEFYSVLTVVFINTLLEGMVFANSFNLAGEGLGVPERRFCRALLTGALYVSMMAAALNGLTTETHLREHCVQVFDELTCFTRSPTAWEPSVSCVL